MFKENSDPFDCQTKTDSVFWSSLEHDPCLSVSVLLLQPVSPLVTVRGTGLSHPLHYWAEIIRVYKNRNKIGTEPQMITLVHIS